MLPPAHRLADAPVIGPAELVEEKVILLDPINTPGVYLHRRLEEGGVRLKRVVETNLAFAALGLVRSGVGIFVTDPIVLLSGLNEGLVVRPVQPEIPVDLVAIYARQRPLPRLAVRFMAHLRPTVTQLCEQIATAWCEASAG